MHTKKPTNLFAKDLKLLTLLYSYQISWRFWSTFLENMASLRQTSLLNATLAKSVLSTSRRKKFSFIFIPVKKGLRHMSQKIN